MPGFEIDAISARKFVKSVAEWNLPPIRFESVGTPAFFLSWIRPVIFVAAISGGALNEDLVEDNKQTYTSVGFQLDLYFTVVHRLPMTLSAGYAAGFRKGTKLDDEIMLSLKIL